MTSAQTAPKEGRSADRVTSKFGIGLVVVLALLALVVGLSSGSNSSPLYLAASKPMRVTIPMLGVSSTLVPTGVNPDGSLQVPPLSQPMQASWYDRSPTPGAQGPAIVLGHINGSGRPGIFMNLDKVQVGQEILIDREDGQTVMFMVDHVDTVPKDAFPTGDVYNDTSDAQLRLITCGGDLDREAHSYLSNVIVFARLVSVNPTAQGGR